MKNQTTNYWVSNNRGNGDCFDCSTYAEVCKLLKTNETCKRVLAEDGHIFGGKVTDIKDKRMEIKSNGEFRIINGRVKYFPDYVETDQY